MGGQRRVTMGVALKLNSFLVVSPSPMLALAVVSPSPMLAKRQGTRTTSDAYPNNTSACARTLSRA
eukprot:scaffold98927_cov60-Phaeocystis_antarctica.AAC.4